MPLRDRLRQLQRQAGATPPRRPEREQAGAEGAAEATAGPAPSAPVPGDGRALRQRLARLERGRAAPVSSAPADTGPVGEAALRERLGAREVAEGLLLIERRLPLPTQPEMAAQLAALPDGAAPAVTDWVFIDTETTGLAGGAGTTVFLLGLARPEGGQLVLRQWLLTRFAGERAMLEQAQPWLGEGVGLISYNGKSFDAPLLATRCRLSGVADWTAGRLHRDLLHPLRRAFASRWPDCRLATVESRLLGLQRQGDLPGSEAPAAWLAWLRNGRSPLLPEVIRHNAQDLHSLALLLPRLGEVYRDPAAWSADLGGVGQAWLQAGQEERARALLAQVPQQLSAAQRLTLARLHRRAGDWPAALAQWEALAATGVPEALEALAKFYEHQQADPLRALGYAQRLPAGAERDRRMQRLSRRLPSGLV